MKYDTAVIRGANLFACVYFLWAELPRCSSIFYSHRVLVKNEHLQGTISNTWGGGWLSSCCTLNSLIGMIRVWLRTSVVSVHQKSELSSVLVHLTKNWTLSVQVHISWVWTSSVQVQFSSLKKVHFKFICIWEIFFHN